MQGLGEHQDFQYFNISLQKLTFKIGSSTLCMQLFSPLPYETSDLLKQIFNTFPSAFYSKGSPTTAVFPANNNTKSTKLTAR